MRADFAFFDDAQASGTYCNSATAGLPPRECTNAMRAVLDSWDTKGALDWKQWHGAEVPLRDAAKRIMQRNRVALVPAASTAAGLVAHHVCATHGPGRVVVLRDDFSSCNAPFVDAARATCRDVVALPFAEGGAVDIAALLELIRSGTVACVAVCHVQAATGFVLDVQAVYDACQSVSPPVDLFVDLTQSLLAVEVPAMPRAYLACSTYKWLLCPKGMALLSVPGDGASVATPWRWWGAHRQPHSSYFGFESHEEDPDTRLDVSSSWLLVVGAAASLQYLVRVGPAIVLERNAALARMLRAKLSEAGLQVLFSGDKRCDVCPIVSIACGKRADAVAALLAQRKIQCAVRSAYVRISVHFYNDEADLNHVVAALCEALQ